MAFGKYYQSATILLEKLALKEGTEGPGRKVSDYEVRESV